METTIQNKQGQTVKMVAVATATGVRLFGSVDGKSIGRCCIKDAFFKSDAIQVNKNHISKIIKQAEKEVEELKVLSQLAEKASKSMREKARNWDDIHNEGGEGYNPYRR